MIRYKSIDSFRGIAALMVVLFHLSGNLKVELSQILPEFVMKSISFGYLGVPIFFVISGVVIALSVGKARVTPSYVGNFALRRSIRLDPTYWVAILIAISLLYLKTLMGYSDEPLPSFGSILAHMFYLQDLLTISPQISVVYWTLCLEIQLYLFYILTMLVCQSMNKVNSQALFTSIALLFGFASLLYDYEVLSVSKALFISYWHYFLLGVLFYNMLAEQKGAKVIFFSWLAIEVLFLSYFELKTYAIAGCCFIVLLYGLWKAKRLEHAFTSKGFIFLGTISYTLYLIHPDIGWKFISIVKAYIGRDLSSIEGLVLFFASILVSIFSAYVLHMLVEKPSLKLNARLKRSKG